MSDAETFHAPANLICNDGWHDALRIIREPSDGFFKEHGKLQRFWNERILDNPQHRPCGLFQAGRPEDAVDRPNRLGVRLDEGFKPFVTDQRGPLRGAGSSQE